VSRERSWCSTAGSRTSRFRQRMRQDPIAAAEMLDTDLDEHQRKALRSLDWSLSDEELQELLDKHLYC
jgi:hypothetical protein